MYEQDNPIASDAPGARCARHPSDPAVVICSRCGSYACVRCQRSGPDGRDYCLTCVPREEALAERADRFLANLVDQFVIFFPWFVAGIFEAILAGGRNEENAAAGLFVVMGALASLVVAVYQVILAARSGQSIGKRWRNIRVVRTDGSPASLTRILLLRNFVPLAIGSMCGLFGLVDSLMIFGEERRCLHDLFADTKVIRVFPDER